MNVDSVVGYSSTLQGETATYHCSAGFTLIGSDTRVCGANGQWSDSEPLCVANGKIP